MPETKTQPALSKNDIDRFWTVVVPHFGLDTSFDYDANPSRIKDYLNDYDKTPEAAQTLERLSDQQLLGELAARGLVVSSWSTEDMSFMDDDESTLELDDGQLERLKTAVLEGCGRGLQEVLGDRGNNFLSEWWEQNKAEMISAAQAPVTDQVERG